MDGLLSFWVLSAVFAIIGAALKGLIRPLSLATLAIATLFIVPGKMMETVNAVRAGEFKLALPSLPPPPPPVPTARNSTPTNTIEPVPLDPNTSPSSRITTPPPSTSASADKGWNLVDLTAESALPPVTAAPSTAAPSTTPAPTSSVSNSPPNNPPVSGLW